tara:strand:- start:167 stop:805 length:639 start_codon:yes stop_codon:yes gene_type:complete
MWAMKKRKADFAKFLFSIKPMTLRDIYQKERFIEDGARIKARAYIDSLYDDESADLTQEEQGFLKNVLDQPLFEALKTKGNFKPNHENRSFIRTRDVVEIDFSQPDHILKRQFEQYIKKTRKNFPDLRKPFRFKRPKYKRWYDFGLIPYLDLKIWSQENKVKIPHRVLADVIFPNQDKDEESVRKSTQRIAKKVISNDYLRFMICLVAEEKS